jgi:hypothetical protein
VIQVLALLVVLGIGVGAVLLLRRLIGQITEVARQAPAEEPRPAEPPAAISADGLVYLFAHRFVRSPVGPQRVSGRRQVFAPQTGEELDPRDLAEQLISATLIYLREEGAVAFRMEECEPSFFPPFPNKQWTMLVTRNEALPAGPLADVIGRAVDMIEQRLEKQGQPPPHYIGLDEVIEQAIRIARQELTFWQKAGVYADLRSYVEAALVAQGYLVMPPRETWLERMRQARPQVREETAEGLEARARALERVLERFRDEHGRPPPEGPLPDNHPRTLADVDPAIITEEFSPGEMPLYDCLRVTIHEALASLRQVEPSEDI